MDSAGRRVCRLGRFVHGLSRWAGGLQAPLLVTLVVVLALAFDFTNGIHDAANSIATVVSTRVLTPLQAVVWAAFFNFVAAYVFGMHVAMTIGTGVVHPDVVDTLMILSGLLGAILWNLMTWRLGLPTSSSHALIGGLAGAAIAKAGFGSVILSGLLKIAAFIVLSPLIGLVLSFVMGVGMTWLFRNATPRRVDFLFRKGQLVSAALYSLGHGTNDAQKTMGIIALLLYSSIWKGRTFEIRFLDEAGLLRRHGLGDPDRRLANRQDDGIEDHQARPVRRLLRRIGSGRQRSSPPPPPASPSARPTPSPGRSSDSGPCGGLVPSDGA